MNFKVDFEIKMNSLQNNDDYDLKTSITKCIVHNFSKISKLYSVWSKKYEIQYIKSVQITYVCNTNGINC